MADGGRLLFGGASVDITPPLGRPMGGYVARGGAGASGTHDPLEAVVLSVRDPHRSGSHVTWVVLDAIAVDAELAGLVGEAVGRAAGCPPEAVLVAATHTHSGPAGWTRSVHPVLGDTADPVMRTELVERLAGAATRARERERSVRIVTAEGNAPGVGTNRTDPAGRHDSSVGVLAFIDDDGSAAGCLVDHASHGTVLGHDNRLWSADWPGAARRALQRGLDGLLPFEPAGHDGLDARFAREARPIVAVAQGAAGDASPRFTRRAQSFAEVDRLGALLSAHALETLLFAPADTAHTAIAVARETLRVPTRHLPPRGEARRLAAAAHAAWRAIADGEGPGPRERIARTRHEGAELLVRMADAGLPADVDLPLTAVALGESAWVHVPVELYASFGLAIRAGSPFERTRVIGYANGYFGYVADAAAHEAGVYEAAASLFDATAGDRIVDASLALLARVRRETRNVAASVGSGRENAAVSMEGARR